MWYQIDAADKISMVSADWKIFAKRNGARGLIGDALLGRSIWGFIDGDMTKTIYSRVFEAVRQSRLPVHSRLNCDAPGIKRLIVLTVEPGDGQKLRVTSQTLNEHMVPHQDLWDRTVPRGPHGVTVCSWCKFIAMGAHGWLPLAEAARLDAALIATCPPRPRHAACPDCVASMESEVSRVQARGAPQRTRKSDAHHRGARAAGTANHSGR